MSVSMSQLCTIPQTDAQDRDLIQSDYGFRCNMLSDINNAGWAF